MEWVSGSTLQRRVRAVTGTRDARARIGWIAQLGEAVSALHSATRTAGNPMVHRDIKPANCMIDDNGRLVLVDVGAMRRTDSSYDARGLHSRRYTAPEVLADLHGPRSAASDVYSRAAVAYFCLTRQDPPEHGHLTPRRIRAAIDAPRRWRRQLAAHLAPALSPRPEERASIGPDAWARQLLRITARRRKWPAALGLTLAVLVAAVVSLYATGILTIESVATAPGGSTQSAAGMRAFGGSYQDFAFTAGDSSLFIEPPADYRHLWGGYLPAQRCATTVEFDVVLTGTPRLPAYGLAVAPRSALVDDQPQGASIQFEYETPELTSRPGSYVRPATLPGGAWSIAVRPTPAPDLRQARHVRIYAVGSTMAIDIDGRQIAEYDLSDVECGGAAIRVWGAAFTFTGLSVRGT
jgi:serine/threonine protein kinase